MGINVRLSYMANWVFLHNTSMRKLLPTFILLITLITPIHASAEGNPIDYQSTQWGLSALSANELGINTGKGVTVAVVDTGIDYTHENLTSALLPGFSTLNHKDLPTDSNQDPVGHGTHVAGIIAGQGINKGILGLAPGVKILPVQVLGTFGGSDENVADGIEYAVKAGAKVINLSLGGSVNPFDKSTPLSCEAIAKAYLANVVVVVASGNSKSSGNPLNQPASCPHAISVAAVGPTLEPATFSSFDSSVMISAPGVDITSTIPKELDALNSYIQWSGTSMATPFVSASIALYLSAFPDASVDQVLKALKDSAIDLSTPGFDAYTGYGLVNPVGMLGLPFKNNSTTELVKSINRNLIPSFLSVYFTKLILEVDLSPVPNSTIRKSVLSILYKDGTTFNKTLTTSIGLKKVTVPTDPLQIEYIYLTQTDSNGYTHTSLPYYELINNNPVPTVKVVKDLKKFTAKFTDTSIIINYGLDKPVGKTLELFILNDDIGIFITKSFTADATGIYNYKIENPILLEHAVSMVLSSANNSLNYSLYPKYLIMLEPEVSEKVTTYKVNAQFYCLSGVRICDGATVTLYSNKKVIAKQPITPTGVAYFTLKTKLPNLQVKIGKTTSRIIK